MGKLRSGRVKRIPQIGITSDRYEFLGLNQAEPNLGDPTVGPSSIGANPIPVGQVFQPVSVSTKEGERYWTPLVGFGTTVGVISVYENGFLPNGDNRFQRINGLNFVGTGVTVETTSIEGPFEGVGIATIRFELDRLINKGDVGQVIYNSPSGYVDGANEFIYYNSNVGIGSTTPNVKLDVVGDGNFTGIVTARYFSGTATTAINVIGGIGSLSSLSVTGITTLGFLTATNAYFTGIVTAPTFIGNLTGTATSVSGGTASVTSLNVTGVSTLGFLTGTDAYFTGIVTAKGFTTLGPTSFDNVTIGNLNVTGITTLGITTASSLYITGITTLGITTTSSLYVSGISTLGTIKISSGIITSSNPGVTTVFYYGDGSGLTNVTATTFSGIASAAKKLETERIFNISGNQFTAISTSFDGTQNATIGLSLSSSININTSGIITATKFVGDLTGTATTATTAGTATTAINVIGGIGSLTSLSVTGITTLGVLTGTDAYFTGIVTAKGFVTLGPTSFDNVTIGNLNVTGITTLGTVNISSGIITSSNPGVTTVFYYGDGSGLTGVIATSSTGIATIAKKLETERIFNISGNQFTAISTSFDGTQNATIGLSLATQSGVTSGVYGNSNTIPIFGVNSSGIITSTSSVTIDSVSGNAGTATTATNLKGGSASQIPYQTGDSTTSFIPNGTTGQVLKSNGTSAPSWDNITNLGAATTIGILADNSNQNQYLTYVTGIGDTTLGISTISSKSLTFNPSSGNLGIGTTNPKAKLHVEGDALVTGISTLGFVKISSSGNNGIITATSIGSTVFYYGDGSGLINLPTSTVSGGSSITISSDTGIQNQYLTYAIGTGSTTILGITTTGLVFNPSSGNLGIGTTNPTRTLSIIGDIGIGRSIYDSKNSSGTPGQILQSTATGIAWTSSSSIGISSYWAVNNANILYPTVNNISIGSSNENTGGTAESSLNNDRYLSHTFGHYYNSQDNLGMVLLNSYPSATSGYSINLVKSRGTTPGNILTTLNNDVLGTISFQGISTALPAHVKQTIGSAIKAEQDGVGGLHRIPGRLMFHTTPVGVGTTACQERMRIDNSGNIGIGTTTPSSNLHVQGDVLVTGISTLGLVKIYSSGNTGIITATSIGSTVFYYGDGYNLTRTKQSYRFNNTFVGSGTTLNFIGAGVSSVTLLNDIVTVNIPATVKTVNTYTATSGQTTFLASYNLGFVDVYVNGSKLTSNQYTATNGTSIVLNSGASLGAIVDIIGYMTYKVVGTQIILSDTVSSVSGITTSYTGLADQGSSQSDNVWTIRRAVFTSAGILSSAATAVNVAWINRLSVTYT